MTESCPPDCMVDFFTELISLLNKYDASLKVNKDLVDELRDQSKNDMVLTGKLVREKQGRKADLEESLVSEEMADQEIALLKKKIKELESWGRFIQIEIDTKNEVIKVLSRDCEQLSNKSSMQAVEIEPFGSKLDCMGPFIFPKVTSRPSSIEAVKDVKTKNRFSALTPEAKLVSPAHHGQKIRA